MSVRVSSRGVLETQDNRQNMSVDGTLSAGSLVLGTGMTLVSTALSSSAPAPVSPGLYSVYGNTDVTGTLPSPLKSPGSLWMIVNDSGPTGMLLSGSSVTTAANLFANAGSAGNTLAIPARGSVILAALGVSYVVLGNSGSITIA